jgi:hypothetical protein
MGIDGCREQAEYLAGISVLLEICLDYVYNREELPRYAFNALQKSIERVEHSLEVTADILKEGLE